MTRVRVACFALECDHCSRSLGDKNSRWHYTSPELLAMDADALDRGWTTDGRGLWHCPECPSLIDQALKVENVDEGQEPLAPDIGVDEQEVLLRRAGYVPWVP